MKQLLYQSDRSQREAWAPVLGVEPKDTSGLLLGIASVVMLVAEAKEKISAVIGGKNPELHLQAFDHLDRVFATLNLDSNANTFLHYVKEAESTLRFSVDLVGRIDMAGELDEALLTELIEDVNAHLEALISSGLPADARVVLHHRLTRVRDAAEGLRLRGIAHLASTLDATAGAAMRVNKDLNDPKQRQWYKGLANTINLGHAIISVAEKVKQIPEIGEKLLGSG
ncbi:MAG: hypothetical protein OXT72_11460 [Gammaproteobacteria bacterium]|nr:hypothetical protein [Gammaproteobacteria bacterium]